jgi:hypothetical protein
MVEMALNQGRSYWLFALFVLDLGVLTSWLLIKNQPRAEAAMFVEMSSSSTSAAQVYYDTGGGFNEADSATQPVQGDNKFHQLRFGLPRKSLLNIRFDPLRSAGSVEIRNVRILDSDGTLLRAIEPSELKIFSEVQELVAVPGGVRAKTVDNSTDSALMVHFAAPVQILPRAPMADHSVRNTVLVMVVSVFAGLIFIVPRLRTSLAGGFGSIDARFGSAGARISSPHFITFDALSIWFYAGCAALFLFNVAGDLNGTSMAFNTRAVHQYGVEETIAGTAKEVRAEEWDFISPYTFYQSFRTNRFEAADSPFGNFYTSLMGNVPVRHPTTLFRPQYWGFFALPLDYGFSFFWQMKWLLMLSGSFTLLLLLTGSSFAGIAGALWLYYSGFTQWMYSSPSMLPEMCGTFCFLLVFAMYLTVGTQRWALAVFSVLLAACAVNFALCASLPHLVPYFWAGTFVLAGWVYSRWNNMIRNENSGFRWLAMGAAAVLTSAMMGLFYRDAGPALAGLGATIYPGHRPMDGGLFTLADFASHIFGGVETEGRFPPKMGNVGDASGFLWLAPATLLCWAAVRSLSKERKIFFGCLWLGMLILAGWDLRSIPAAAGRWLMLDHTFPQATLPALGLVNIAIVMLVMSAPEHRRKPSLDMKLLFSAATAFLALAMTNSAVGNMFSLREIVFFGGWLTLLVAFLWNVSRRAFATTVLLPSFCFFCLINPVSRGIGAITSSQLYQYTEAHKELRQGKWLVFSPDLPFGIFAGCGLNSYVGRHYLPKIEDFATFRSHGVDTKEMNSEGMLLAKALPPGKQSFLVSRRPGIQEWNVSPADPLIKDLGIRYVAFDRAPASDLLDGLRPLSATPVSGFWLYQLAR